MMKKAKQRPVKIRQSISVYNPAHIIEIDGYDAVTIHHDAFSSDGEAIKVSEAILLELLRIIKPKKES